MNTLLSLSESAAVVFLGIGSVWFSRRAAKLSAPTGNGFAEHVRDDLQFLKEAHIDVMHRLGRIEGKMSDSTHRN